GINNLRGFHAEKLLGETLVPVCSPELLEKVNVIKKIDDLAHHTLLVDEVQDVGGEPPSWSYWAESLGVDLPLPKSTRKFGQSNMVIQAAVDDYGVALGREPLVADAIQNGQLCVPLSAPVPSQYSYWFVCRKSALKSSRVQAFRGWLKKEAERFSLKSIY
ncbi:MAG: LysR substrate-binding domain-containing protein, partial [Pseudomonadota bacterium]